MGKAWTAVVTNPLRPEHDELELRFRQKHDRFDHPQKEFNPPPERVQLQPAQGRSVPVWAGRGSETDVAAMGRGGWGEFRQRGGDQLRCRWHQRHRWGAALETLAPFDRHGDHALD